MTSVDWSTEVQTDLAHLIQQIRMVDTHEHLQSESEWLGAKPDILQDLFGNYVPADLHTAGATPSSIQQLMDKSNADLEQRFNSIRSSWEATQFTGYGEAVRLIAKSVYGIDEITTDSLIENQHKASDFCQSGERLRLLSEVANLDHVQIDNFCWPCLPDLSGIDFFLYDLSWASFCNGQVDLSAIRSTVGIEVSDLNSLERAMSAIFDKYAPAAIAVKSQHAYNRTLHWSPRTDNDASQALDVILTNPSDQIEVQTRLCLGDWAWSKGLELSAEHRLPFKIHTGYYAGNDRMPVSRISAGNMCELLASFPETQFVLMHTAYPYSQELIALAKHYRNVWVDLCWAWSIDPFSSIDFLRRFIHAVPINKLFAFGGDTRWPTSAVAYSIQARQCIEKALTAEIDEGYMTEKQALFVAEKVMHDNQYECFDIIETRSNIQGIVASD